jgi:hypothetical protein
MARFRGHEHEWPQGTGPAPQLTLADVPRRPYAYHGGDFADLAPPAVRPRRRPPRKPGTPMTDPGGPGWPLSAPLEWLRECAEEAL